jgi:GAF domain-containing protein
MTQVEQQVARLRTLTRLNQLVSSSLDIDRILNGIALAAVELTDAAHVSLWVADEATQTLERRAFSDEAVEAGHPVKTLRFGEGGVGWVALHRRPLDIPDLLGDERLAGRNWFHARGLRSVHMVPIIHEESLFGVLALLGHEPFDFDADDRDLLDSFVAQAATAIRNARLFTESESRRREAEILTGLSREINASLDLPTILQRVADSAIDLCGADTAAIALRRPGTDEFVPRFEGGLKTLAVMGRSITPGRGAGGHVLVTGRPFRTEHYAADPRITKDYLDFAIQDGVVAEVVVPIPGDGQIEGLLYVFNSSPRPFSEHDEAVLSRLADQGAIAIKNARLYEETERRRWAAESLAEVGRLITQSLDPREVGQRIVDSVCRLTGARMAVFYHVAPETGDLVPVAGTESVVGRLPVVPRGHATMGLAVSERRPVTTPDVLTDPRITHSEATRDWIERSNYRSALALPLIVGDRVIGALGVGAETGRVFQAEEIALAQSFADQAALAMQNARLYAEATRRRWEAEVLGHVGRDFSESGGADEVAQRIGDSLRALLGAQASLVCRLDPESGDLIACARSGEALETGAVFPPGAGVTGLAVRERQPIVTANLLTDPRIALTPELRARIEAASYRSVLALPLLVKDTVVGGISIGDREGRTFSEDDLRLAKTFADQAAMALENAWLFEDTSRRRREAEVVAGLAQQINASLDLDTVLALASEAARDLCNADMSWIALTERDSGAMILRHWPGARGGSYAGTRVLPGQGMGGLVLLTGRPFRTDDYPGDPRILKDPSRPAEQEGAVTALVVPIQTEGRVEGLLYVENRTPRPFTAQDEAILVRLAEHAAIAIRNARLLDDLKARQARLEALLDVSHQLAQIQPREALLENIARACGQVLDSSSVGFRLVEGEALVLAGTWGDAREAMLTPRLKIGESLSGLVAATGAPLLVEDAAEDPRILAAHRDALRRLGYRSWLGVPVKLGERVVGVLSIRTRREGGFSKEDQAIAAAFASQAATALENTRLFQEVQDAHTEVSRAKNELIQAQKMEAIGRLAGGIAHDFNNLLTIVHGRSEILLRRLGHDAKSRHDVAVIQHTALRAAALTRQLLAFSRKQMLQPKVLSLNGAVADSAAMFRRLIGEDIDLRVVPGAALDQVKADPTQLEQILINLAVNARDAMPRGGRLVIETANVELDEAFVSRHPGSRTGPHVMLSVGDSGVGMTADVQARAFEPFFTTKEKGKGTGLGLATVYGIVKQHEGYVALKSAPGEGTTCSIYLPRFEEPSAVVEPERAPAAAPGRSETILLVEDEDEVRELTREMLEAGGYTVIDAGSGAEALRVCRQHPDRVHLLLTDVVMPGMSGHELALQLATLRPDTKVVYMSGYTDDALGHHGVLEPGVILLEKPFTPDSLLAAVRSALD